MMDSMSGLAEIQHAILELPEEERAQLWEWLQAREVEESPELLAAIDEGIRSIETEGGIPEEEVRKQIATWITG
jgi:predicted transcriptional regulator